MHCCDEKKVLCYTVAMRRRRGQLAMTGCIGDVVSKGVRVLETSADAFLAEKLSTNPGRNETYQG